MGPVKEKWSEEYTPILDDIEIHPPDEWESDVPVYHKRRRAGLWTAIAVLTVALAVLAAYGYSVISQHDAELGWLSTRLGSISAVRAQANRLEASLKDWTGRQNNLAAQVQKMDGRWKSSLNSVRLQAAQLVANAYQKGHDELNQRTAILNAQIAEMASRQYAQQVHIAQLEKELAGTRQELASAKANYNRELASLQTQEVSSQREIASLDNTLSTDQVDFEATKNRDEEIVHGVSLHLTATDLAHQRFRGWIWLAESRRTIWVGSHPIDRPVVFYPNSGGEAYELVVTRVAPKEVAGYLLVPSSTNGQQADVASISKPISRSGRSSF